MEAREQARLAMLEPLLAMCAAGKGQLEKVKRFEMPGFRPRPDWVREMKRYDILSAGAPVDSINVYDTERAYWQSLWSVNLRCLRNDSPTNCPLCT